MMQEMMRTQDRALSNLEVGKPNVLPKISQKMGGILDPIWDVLTKHAELK